MAEIETTGSTFTTVRLRMLWSCPPSPWAGREQPAIPRGRLLASRCAFSQGSRHRGARRCRCCRAADPKPASGSVADRDFPRSSAIPAASFACRQSGRAVGRPRDPVQAGGQDQRTRAPVGLRAEPGLVESQSVVLYPAGPACERIPDPPDRGFHVSVDLHQPMMQPLDRPRTCGIESHPLRHLFKTPQGVAWDSRVRNKNAYA